MTHQEMARAHGRDCACDDDLCRLAREARGAFSPGQMRKAAREVMDRATEAMKRARLAPQGQTREGAA